MKSHIPSSSSSSRKCTSNNLEMKKQNSPRSPLKDLNTFASSFSSSSSSSSSSTTSASSMSIDAPKGCLRFFLSNSSSFSNSKTPLYNIHNKPSKPFSKTTPNVKPNGSKPSIGNNSRLPISANPGKPTSQKLQKPKKNLPCLWKANGRNTQKTRPLAGAGSNGISVNKFVSGSEVLKDQHEEGGDADRGIELGISGMKDENCTPISNKLAFGSIVECTFDKAINDDNSDRTFSTTPPVEATVSPEIQCGSSMLSTASRTPVCLSEVEFLSGLPDKRKCRPRGILTIGENSSSEFDDENGDVVGVVKSSRLSMVPLPAEASMRWHVSPGDQNGDKEGNGIEELNKHGSVMGSIGLSTPSPPSSSPGFSPNVSNSNNDSSATTATTATTNSSIRRRSSFSISPSGQLESQRLLVPSFDQIASCSFSSSPVATPKFKGVDLHEEGKHCSELGGENSPFSMDTIGSENVIQTPRSDSSSESDVGLIANETSKHRLESELDFITEVLRRTSCSANDHRPVWDPTDSSFEFDHLITHSDPIDFTQLQKTWDQASWNSNSTMENLYQSRMRISWRDGLESRIFDMDELDCCRCLSDEEDDSICFGNDQLVSCLSPASDANITSDQITFRSPWSPKCADHEAEMNGNANEMSPPQRPNSCAESISTDGGGLVASGDSDWTWTLSYRNQLFQI